jgi:hypothetical protein
MEINSLVTDKRVYPNPVHDQAKVNITTVKRLQNPAIKVYDLQSRLIEVSTAITKQNQTELDFTIDCSNLPAGNYYYILLEEGVAVTSDKFLVE